MSASTDPLDPMTDAFDSALLPALSSEDGVWRTVTLQEGRTADNVARLVDEHGPEVAIAYLAQADHGDPDTVRELQYGYAYEEPPAYGREQVYQSGGYELIVNREAHWAGLTRWERPDAQHPGAPPLPAELRKEPAGAVWPARRSPDRAAARDRNDGSWFAHPDTSRPSPPGGLGR
jgi:hypothetical protein